jgi:hypothetical protein
MFYNLMWPTGGLTGKHAWLSHFSFTKAQLCFVLFEGGSTCPDAAVYVLDVLSIFVLKQKF